MILDMDTLVEAMLQSPLPPRHVERLSQALADEHARRERFYEEITEDDHWEFINGEVFMRSPATNARAVTIKNLSRLLSTYADLRGLGMVLTENVLVRLTRNDYEPDICFFRQEIAAAFAPDLMRHPAPDLIVEVLSPSTARNDRNVKKDDYAAHGVAEYWIVDHVAQTVEVYLPHGEDYGPVTTLPLDAELASAALPGFRVPVRALFDQAANVAALPVLLTAAPSA